MLCSKCGNEMTNDSLFCNKCGSKVETIDSDDNTISKNEDYCAFASKNIENIYSSSVSKENSDDKSSIADTTCIAVPPPQRQRKIVISIIALLAIVAIIIIVISSIYAASICSWENCNESRADGSVYCYKHTCKYKDCTSLAFDGYCYSHNCKHVLCDNIIIDDSEYCWAHKCERSGCKNEKAVGSDFCSSHQVNMRTRLDLSSFWFSLNSAGGIKLHFEVKNNSGKEIKYIKFPVFLYNAVGDSIKSDFGENSIDVEIVGPIKTIGTAKIDGDVIGYCDLAARIDINNITIIYMDGTRESGRFGYYCTK